MSLEIEIYLRYPMIEERRKKKKKKKKGSKGILRCPHHYNILPIALVSTGVYIHMP
jgi:hypothetical protein